MKLATKRVKLATLPPREWLPVNLTIMAGLLAGVVLFYVSDTWAVQAPTIRLFPTNVVEDVKETSRVAKDLESSLQNVITDLEQQWKLYQESKCDGAEGDPGCDQISRQLGEKYKEMLSIMDSQLPQMERSVETTVNSLESRLRKELGQKMTARELQEVLVNEMSQDSRVSATKQQRRSSRRLSERFRRYYELVAQTNSRTRGSLALVAADIYLDSKEVLDLIKLTRNEITRSRLMIEIRHELGEVTPEMTEVVAGVRNILFGEDELAPGEEAVPPADTFPEEYRSPLEF
jgi:hypothetical protein